MKRPFSSSLLAAALLATAGLAAGCAHTGGASGGGTPTPAGSGVEVFGVIDAGVSHTTTKSAR
jgi:hypothetical protein